jgi:hypothetical protein
VIPYVCLKKERGRYGSGVLRGANHDKDLWTIGSISV